MSKAKTHSGSFLTRRVALADDESSLEEWDTVRPVSFRGFPLGFYVGRLAVTTRRLIWLPMAHYVDRVWSVEKGEIRRLSQVGNSILVETKDESRRFSFGGWGKSAEKRVSERLERLNEWLAES